MSTSRPGRRFEGTFARATHLASAARPRTRFGFVEGHAYLTSENVEMLHRLVEDPDQRTVSIAEEHIATLSACKSATAFASGRMALFAALKALGIGDEDEVVVTGSTCAVVCTAVMRTGARVVYSDIDERSLGTDPTSVARSITSATRAVIAQHSFGVPCDIEAIKSLTDARGLFLIEDCALTVGSTINGTPVGSFGDVSIFSTDHTKPINSMIGGFACTQSPQLSTRLRNLQESSAPLTDDHQRRLVERVMLEAQFANPSGAPALARRDLLTALRNRVRPTFQPFLTADATPGGKGAYEYPARLPPALAYLVALEVERWPGVARTRKSIYHEIKALLNERMPEARLPAAASALENEVVPLRFALSMPGGRNFRERLRPVINVDWTWFLEPVVATTCQLEAFGYKRGTCPNAERLGPDMVNIPLPQSEEWQRRLLAELDRALRAN